MKTDIVKRLEQAADTMDAGRPKDERCLYRIAAKEVKELRALVESLQGELRESCPL